VPENFLVTASRAPMDHAPSRQRRDDDVRRKRTRQFPPRDFKLPARTISARDSSFGKRAGVIIRLKLAAKITVRHRPYFRRMHPVGERMNHSALSSLSYRITATSPQGLLLSVRKLQ